MARKDLDSQDELPHFGSAPTQVSLALVFEGLTFSRALENNTDFWLRSNGHRIKLFPFTEFDQMPYNSWDRGIIV